MIVKKNKRFFSKKKIKNDFQYFKKMDIRVLCEISIGSVKVEFGLEILER